MGIYISGMDMPKSCAACNFCADGWCYVISADQEQPGELSSEKRPDWCPLIPVPDHGRLIDADAFEGMMRSVHETAKKEYAGKLNKDFVRGVERTCVWFFENLAETAKTIIPADPGKEAK